MIGQIEPEATVDLKRLLFRRQFLLGPKRFAPNQYWSSIQLLGGVRLSVHSDLPFTSTSQDGATVTLIGHAIDPDHPQRTEPEVLRSLIRNASQLNSLIDSTKPLVGRWVIILQNQQGTYLFTDPCGCRQVFYYSDGEGVWCASQPELIRANCHMNLNTDDALVRFLIDPKHALLESPWLGRGTLYESCFHLMANHYLDLDSLQQTRFYPTNPIPDKDTAEIVDTSCAILQGTMTALTARHDVAQALTAGWDSRVLLAASRHVSEHIEYFVYRLSNLAESHPDISVANRMAKELGINFVVRRPADVLPGWFVSMLSMNVTCARVLPKTHAIYAELVVGDSRISVNGNGSEIWRNYIDRYCDQDIGDVSSTDLAARMFGRGRFPPFVISELDEWKKGFDRRFIGNLNMLDLLYWEQGLGNWGAQYPAERDIAVEQISPFNCRLLIETLLSSPRRLRAEPDYELCQEMIRRMWPEALSFPINPQPEGKGHIAGVLKRRIRPHIPSPVVHAVRSVLNSRMESP